MKEFNKTGKVPVTAFIVHEDYNIQQVKKGFVVAVTSETTCLTDAIDMGNEEVLNYIVKMAKRIEQARIREMVE